MLPLRSGATLADLQCYVAEMEDERGFADSTVLEQSLKLGEEVGELFKAIRKRERLPIDHDSITGTVGEELADVLIYLCAIANREGVSLEHALRSKELLNETRVWSSDPVTP
jgi:NTP pyrophosphatase (non-canonical NTP hydrolase)